MVRAKKQAEEQDTNIVVGSKTLDMKELNKDGFVLMENSTYGKVDDYIPTLLPEIDSMLNGGFPAGRVVSVAAPSGVGKSNLAIQLTKIATQMGMLVAWLDVEGTSDVDKQRYMGVDITKVISKQPDPNHPENMSVEEVAQSIENLIAWAKSNNDTPLLIIWDSIGMTPSMGELSADYDTKQPGMQAKAITTALKKLTPLLNGTKTTLFAVNQVRDDIGGMPSFGKTYNYPGGAAYQHALSTFFQLSKLKPIENSKEYVGHGVKFTLKKSKTSKPFSKGTALLYSSGGGHGFDTGVNAVYKAIELKLLPEPKSAGSKGKQLSLPNPDTGELEEYPYFDTLDSIAENPEEWAPVIVPIFQKVLVYYFPDDFPPLHNKTLKVDNINWFEGLEDYYALDKEKQQEFSKPIKRTRKASEK